MGKRKLNKAQVLDKLSYTADAIEFSMRGHPSKQDIDRTSATMMWLQSWKNVAAKMGISQAEIDKAAKGY